MPPLSPVVFHPVDSLCTCWLGFWEGPWRIVHIYVLKINEIHLGFWAVWRTNICDEEEGWFYSKTFGGTAFHHSIWGLVGYLIKSTGLEMRRNSIVVFFEHFVEFHYFCISLGFDYVEEFDDVAVGTHNPKIDALVTIVRVFSIRSGWERMVISSENSSSRRLRGQQSIVWFKNLPIKITYSCYVTTSQTRRLI